MKKVFRALTETSLEKMFIGNEQEVPEGWYSLQSAAVAALKAKSQPKAQASPQVSDAPKRRGRPPKNVPAPSEVEGA